MGAKATFDTSTFTIRLDLVAPDVNDKVSIDTQVDLYSDAKEDWNGDADLQKFDFPFTTIGGEDLGGGLEAGDYYFLRTDLGWKVQPYDADHELTITGNLYPINAADTLIVATSAIHTVATILERSQLTQTVAEQLVSVVVSATVSATTDNTAIASAVWNAQVTTAVASSSYGEVMRSQMFGPHIHFDGDLGTAGTNIPLGTHRYPVNNFADAFTIADRESRTVVRMLSEGVLTSGTDAGGYLIEGDHPLKVQLQTSANVSTTNTQFRELYMRNATLDGWVVCREAVLENVTGFQGVAHQCMLNPGTVQITGANSSHFLNCFSGQPGTSTPIIDMNGKNVDLGFRQYWGGITIQNNTANNNISLDLGAGQIIIASTCTAGTIVCRGVGKLTDNSNGATVIDEMVATTGGLTAAQSEKLTELWQIFGLDPVNPLLTTTSTRTAGASVTQSITGTPDQSITITRT